MKKTRSAVLSAALLLAFSTAFAACSSDSGTGFTLNKAGYFNSGGVDVMAFNDFYPEGHRKAAVTRRAAGGPSRRRATGAGIP